MHSTSRYHTQQAHAVLCLLLLLFFDGAASSTRGTQDCMTDALTLVQAFAISERSSGTAELDAPASPEEAWFSEAQQAEGELQVTLRDLKAISMADEAKEAEEENDQPTLFQTSLETQEPHSSEKEERASATSATKQRATVVTVPLKRRLTSATLPVTSSKRQAPRVQRGRDTNRTKAVRNNTVAAGVASTAVPKSLDKNMSSFMSSLTVVREEGRRLKANLTSLPRWQAALLGCLITVIALLVIMAVFLQIMHLRNRSAKQKTAAPGESMQDVLLGMWHNPTTASSSTLARSEGRRKVPERSSSPGSASSRSSRSIEAENLATRGSFQVPGLPLCHLLVVPQGTRLACVVQNDVRRRKQELSFDVSATSSRGGAPLFRMRVSELNPEAEPGIFVQTTGDKDQLAFLSTQELWQGKEKPVLTFLRPWGLPYGTLQQNEKGEYLVLRGTTTLISFTGDFQNHNIKVLNSNGQKIASVEQLSPEEYQVQMNARSDAGLVVLGLLAIDKLELRDDEDGGQSP